jgi:hypothetical protein
MSFRYADVKVGDFIRDYKTQQNHTVAAVFEDGSVMTAGLDCDWFSSGEFKIIQTCDRQKHNADIRYWAYASADYMNNDDPRALCNRRKLEQKGIGTANAHGILQDVFNSFVESTIDSIIECAKSGDIESFSDITKEVQRHIEDSGYAQYTDRLIEGLYVALDDVRELDPGERDFLEQLTRRAISDKITDQFRQKEKHSIDLEDPRTIKSFLDSFN